VENNRIGQKFLLESTPFDPDLAWKMFVNI
jgi:hypothetical protein